ncbi:hypothetical protein [Paenibacillus sp. JDR-2]|uniref:hypothetical protein n=1 Tax=Paenibacillus sp. (strain JDR-2) TaxID=324057 RepID=UPI000166A2F1|nr:hypothetical protein [Paenibacillus sp. JDR-2]ACT00442.1 hypothetical protein Pjdr2_1780 [Paenibacillus sp. JDR-2]
MKKLGMLFCVCLLLLYGCRSSDNGLANAQEKIEQSNLSFKIPKLDGYEVIYVQRVGPPKDEQGKAIGDKQEVLVAYANHKGKLVKPAGEQKANKDILYGPYQGETLIAITYSNYGSELDNSQVIIIGGEQVQRAVAAGERTLLVFNGEEGSITLEYNKLDEAAITSLTEQVIKENK